MIYLIPGAAALAFTLSSAISRAANTHSVVGMRLHQGEQRVVCAPWDNKILLKVINRCQTSSSLARITAI